MVEAKGEELVARDEVLCGGQGGLFEVGAAEALENVVTLALNAVTVAVRRANVERRGRRMEGERKERRTTGRRTRRKRSTKKKRIQMSGAREQRRQSDRLAK